jgi:hypothetical protein
MDVKTRVFTRVQVFACRCTRLERSFTVGLDKIFKKNSRKARLESSLVA